MALIEHRERRDIVGALTTGRQAIINRTEAIPTHQR
jgi:hypothetical protein